VYPRDNTICFVASFSLVDSGRLLMAFNTPFRIGSSFVRRDLKNRRDNFLRDSSGYAFGFTDARVVNNLRESKALVIGFASSTGFWTYRDQVRDKVVQEERSSGLYKK
jgi:hypothetical protein